MGTFFDNIIVFSKIEEKHWKHLVKVYEQLQANKLVINGKKSEFFMLEIHFLVYIVSKDEV